MTIKDADNTTTKVTPFQSLDKETRQVTINVIIPALNEEKSLPHTLTNLSTQSQLLKELAGVTLMWRDVVVVDNGSEDKTAQIARDYGARVVKEPKRGYGRACLSGIQALSVSPPDLLLFVDADGSDDLGDLDLLLGALLGSITTEQTKIRHVIGDHGPAELVIGSRVQYSVPGALTPLQRFGNALSCALIKLAFGAKFTDLGPLRAIHWSALERLHMRDQDFGWTVEMQAKAAARGIASAEVDVCYLPRYAGESKISGTLIGSYRAGVKILVTIARIWWSKK